MTLKFVPENKGPAVIKAKSSNTLSDEYRDSLAISYSFIGTEEADIRRINEASDLPFYPKDVMRC